MDQNARQAGWRVLGDDADVKNDKSHEGSDAERETAEMQPRMDGASVTDARHQENDVGQYGESKPTYDENFSVDRFPGPGGRTQSYESQRSGTKGDRGGGGESIPAYKAYIRVQKKKQEGYRVFGEHDKNYKSAIAGIGRAEELGLGKQGSGYERVGERGNAERNAETIPGCDNVVCGSH